MVDNIPSGGNGIKLEHRLTHLETKLGFIHQSIKDVSDMLKEHVEEREDLKDDLAEINTKLEQTRTWIRVFIWFLGTTGVGGGALAGLLKLMG